MHLSLLGTSGQGAVSSTLAIRIGRLGSVRPRPGHNLYVGSSFGPGGLRVRIGHYQP
jgi:hypothetical protein